MSRATALSINGIVLLDKPIHLTSNAALQKVKRIYNARKAGHTGSLDPLASGMLPICFGEATKFSQFLLEADKVYRVTARLGIRTATGDAEGEVLLERPVQVTPEQLTAVLAKFRGEVSQIPSMYSALKHQGRPLYELARQGIEVERKARTVKVERLELIQFTGNDFSFEVHCSKGTYIRTLVEDIGEALGCGAYVTELRRIQVLPYQTDQMVTLPQLEELRDQQSDSLMNYLLPLESLITHAQEINLSEAAAFYLKRGQPVIVPYAPNAGLVKLKLKNGEFFGMGEIMHDGRVAPRRLVKA